MFAKSPPLLSIGHGPLKLRTVHLRDNTIIYESKVSVVFPDLKAPLCQDHTQNFRSIAHSSKKIETPQVYIIH
jgi:peroxiredoxin